MGSLTDGLDLHSDDLMTPCRCPNTPGKPAKDKHHTSYCETGRKEEAKAIHVELPQPRRWHR